MGKIKQMILRGLRSRENAVDILGVGAQKSATSWAAYALNLHPSVWIPTHVAFSGKEVSFWDNRMHRGIDWYTKNLRPPQTGLKVMDVSPGYLRIDRARVKLCHQASPRARVFLILRNPVHRDWSSLLMEAGRLGFEPKDAPFKKLKDFYERTPVEMHTDYLGGLERWRSFYQHQLFVGLYDDVQQDSEAFYKKLCEHCKIDPTQISDWKEKVKVKIFKGPGLPIPSDFEDYLREKYRPMIGELSTELGRNLSHWLESE